METTASHPVSTHLDSLVKRPSLFKRFRRSFTSVFRRKSTRKRINSVSQETERDKSGLNSDEKQDRRASLPIEPKPKTIIESGESTEADFRPVAKVPIFVNDFTCELKQSLQLRSKKIEEGDKSPTNAIKQMEKQRLLSGIVDDEKEVVKAEPETKTFGERLALFEIQISGVSSSSTGDSLNRRKSENSDFIDGGNVDSVAEDESVSKVLSGDEYKSDHINIVKRKSVEDLVGTKMEDVCDNVQHEDGSNSKVLSGNEYKGIVVDKPDHIDMVKKKSVEELFGTKMEDVCDNVQHEDGSNSKALSGDEYKGIVVDKSGHINMVTRKSVEELVGTKIEDVCEDDVQYGETLLKELSEIEVKKQSEPAQEMGVKSNIDNEVESEKKSSDFEKCNESEKSCSERKKVLIKNSKEDLIDFTDEPKREETENDNKLPLGVCNKEVLDSESKISSIDDFSIKKCNENYEDLQVKISDQERYGFEMKRYSDVNDEINSKKVGANFEYSEISGLDEARVDSQRTYTIEGRDLSNVKRCTEISVHLSSEERTFSQRTSTGDEIDDSERKNGNENRMTKVQILDPESTEKLKIAQLHGFYSSESGTDYVQEDIKYTTDFVKSVTDNKVEDCEVVQSFTVQPVLNKSNKRELAAVDYSYQLNSKRSDQCQNYAAEITDYQTHTFTDSTPSHLSEVEVTPDNTNDAFVQ